MSFVSKGHSINCNSVTLGGIYADSTTAIDIRHSDPSKKILINGVEPAAGGVNDPLNLNNINAAVAMTTPSITPPAAGGGLVIKANGLIAPDGAGEVLNISTSTIDVVGNVSLTGATSAIRFGLYSFKPRQLYKDLTAFSFNSTAIGATNLIFRTDDTDWVNVNTGATGQSLDLAVGTNKGAYKLAFQQTSNGSQNQIADFRFMSDIVLSRPNDNAPNVVLPSATAFSYQAYDGTAPEITMTPAFLYWNVYARFPNVSGNETANVRITLTQMPFFG